ncbi:MAG: bifunctional nuclease family protein [Candidatus Schekmanbacteria bacterium]|nr:MAG: bifunctional nuclease family protein [Candidatus Schekmanbacteria bacterium]
MKEMKVSNLMLDPVSKTPIVILKDVDMTVMLPIWVGYFEATAIALELEKTATPRPMTHDLLRNIIEKISCKVKKIIINDLRNNTFYAVIELQKDGTILEIDSRPSDAIALALRTNAPIYVEEFVLKAANSVDISEIDTDEKWKELLENLKPEDFGKYKM